MATGASTCDFAVILVDARKGILSQTCRHACIVSLLGIRRIALAVNKMDLVGYAKDRFEQIAQDFVAFSRRLGFEDVVAIPLSALEGDNVIAASARMSWYGGPTLMAHLETVDVSRTSTSTRASECPCSGSTGPTRISAVMPARSPPERCVLAMT